MEEECELCQMTIVTHEWRYVDPERASLGKVHSECGNKAIIAAIAAREAEKPKAPTLRIAIIDEIRELRQISTASDIADRIIAMVREYDGTTDWKARAEKLQAKIDAARSELST
jgi:hypothetical protein